MHIASKDGDILRINYDCYGKYQPLISRTQAALLADEMARGDGGGDDALIVGHHDLNPLKACPCFDAAKEYKNL